MKEKNKPGTRTLTHVDESGNPGMVDISDKAITKRNAIAQAIVVPGEEIIHHLQGDEIMTKKGPVFQTAIIAGTMGCKKTSDLIPLCHPLALEKCKIHIKVNENKEIIITCTASITSKTGVEMEALTGATVAALTIYDMCKAFSHNIIIKEIKLLEKTGGKSDYKTIAEL
ncbi:cyclic pyranopterin monophosphate synthase MoaC [soil metagenome]